jgi:DNA-binding SARP family transcriptional activator
MGIGGGNLDHTIELLRDLIERSPADSRNRLRLLALLHANGRKYDFVAEARQYKDNCDLTFDTNWEQVCEMGKEIDPGNEFFGKLPRLKSLPADNGRSSGTRLKTRSRPVRKPQTEQAKPDRQPERKAPVQEAPHDDSDRREFTERRAEDRRKNFSAWFGEERRKYQRRQKRRRGADTSVRRKS